MTRRRYRTAILAIACCATAAACSSGKSSHPATSSAQPGAHARYTTPAATLPGATNPASPCRPTSLTTCMMAAPQGGQPTSAVPTGLMSYPSFVDELYNDSTADLSRLESHADPAGVRQVDLGVWKMPGGAVLEMALVRFGTAAGATKMYDYMDDWSSGDPDRTAINLPQVPTDTAAFEDVQDAQDHLTYAYAHVGTIEVELVTNQTAAFDETSVGYWFRSNSPGSGSL